MRIDPFYRLTMSSVACCLLFIPFYFFPTDVFADNDQDGLGILEPVLSALNEKRVIIPHTDQADGKHY